MADINVDDLLARLDEESDGPTPQLAKSSGLDYLLKAAGYVPAFGASSVIAERGRALNSGIQSGIGSAVEKAGELHGERVGKAAAYVGTGLGTAADYLIPQNELGVLGSVVAGGKLLDAPAKAAAASLRASGKAPFLKPSAFDKTMGQAASARSAVRPEYAADVMADPTILSEKTLPKSQVSDMFNAYFKKMGAKIDSEKFKSIGGSRYPAGVNEVGRLEKMVEGVLNRIDAGEKVPLEDAFLARQAASRLMASEKAQRLPQMRRMAAQDEGKIVDYMESIGGGEIKELNRLWRRASIKEAFSKALPQNKNMSPNALRSFAMGEQFARAGEALSEGRLIPAALRGMSALTMSPLFLGSTMRGVSPLYSALGYSGAAPGLRAAGGRNGR